MSRQRSRWTKSGACAAAVLLLAGLAHVTGAADRLESPLQGAGLTHGTQGFVLTPTRIVFEGRRRAATLTLANTGTSPATYRVTLVRMRMSMIGKIAPVDAPQAGEAFADTLVRYSPRQFEVAPRSSQVVRIQLRKPVDLPEGEYRSHLLIQEMPRPAGSAETSPTDDPSEPGVQVRLTPVFGTAIPVIVRHGNVAAGVSFADFYFRPALSAQDRPSVSFAVVRTGNRSVYGDLECVSLSDPRKPRVVGRMRGIAVYTPNSERWVGIPLEGIDPSATGGRLLVRFRETTLNAQAIAESTFAMQ
jgi:hypothetical protein